MQTKAFTGVAATTQVLSEATLGFDPTPYSFFYIQVLGADTETWQVKCQVPGGGQYAAIDGPSTTLPIPGSVVIGPNHVANVGELQVAFTGGTPTDATILVMALNRPGMGQR